MNEKSHREPNDGLRPAWMLQGWSPQVLLESRFIEAAWFEALSTITKGIVHATNNSLAGVLGLCDVLLTPTDHGTFNLEDVKPLKESAKTAVGLVNRLQQLHVENAGRLEYHDLNGLVAEVMEVMQHVVRRRVELTLQLASNQLPLESDGVELRRAIIYLTLRIAAELQGRGRIHFVTSQHEKAPAFWIFKEGEDPPPGRFLCLAIEAGAGESGPVYPLQAGVPSGSIELLALAPDSHWELLAAWILVDKNRGAIAADSLSGGSRRFELWMPRADLDDEPGPGANAENLAFNQQSPPVKE